MVRHFRHPDIDAHEPGCRESESGEPCVSPNSAYIDVFCDCHHYTEPKLLMNGTDVAWPAGWSQQQADAWRRGNSLLAPMGEQVAVGKATTQTDAQNDPDIESNNPRQDDPAPVV